MFSRRSESEITRERLSLEEAVARSNRKPPSAPARQAGPVAGGVPRAAAKRSAAPMPAPPEAENLPGVPPGPPRAASAAGRAREGRPPLGQEEPRPPRNLRADAPPNGAPRPQPPQLPMRIRRRCRPVGGGAAPRPRKRPPPPPRRPACAASATSPPTPTISAAPPRRPTAPREDHANVPSPSPEFDRLEPSMENRGADPEAPYSYDESLEEADRYAPQPPQQPTRDVRGSRRTATASRKSAPAPARFPFKSAIAVGILLILVGVGILWGKPLLTTVSGMFKSSPTTEATKDQTAPQSRPKIPDRVGQTSSDNVAPVAQRVVLYDEDPSDPKGKQYVGSVIWRTEPIKASGNQKPDIAVRADIEIPDRKFKMTMSFRRNTDSSLPASHTAELTFILPQDFSGGGVSNVPGILMKSNEQARGTPLAGLAVKVTDGFFLVGLSNVDFDRTRNLQLLKERSWFDVPLVYVNGRRAIIAIEKGSPGERAFNDAFAAWGE